MEKLQRKSPESVISVLQSKIFQRFSKLFEKSQKYRHSSLFFQCLEAAYRQNMVDVISQWDMSPSFVARRKRVLFTSQRRDRSIVDGIMEINIRTKSRNGCNWLPLEMRIWGSRERIILLFHLILIQNISLKNTYMLTFYVEFHNFILYKWHII